MFLIVIDLDGTLVKNFTQNDDESFDYLKTLTHTQKVVICTGRPYRAAMDYYQMLNLDTPMINYNGSWVHNPKDPSFTPYHDYLNKEEMAQVEYHLKDKIHNFYAEIDDDIYINRIDYAINEYVNMEGARVFESSLSNLPSDPNSSIIFPKKGYEQDVFDYIQKNTHSIGLRDLSSPSISLIELYALTSSKGKAVRLIQDYYHIDRHHTITIGDGINDISMFDVAKYSVAMGNANDFVKSQAHYTTLDLDHHGVKAFLEPFFTSHAK